MAEKNKNDILTIQKLAPYIVFLVIWVILCTYLVKTNIIGDSIIYIVMSLPTSTLTMYILWLYTKTRKDSIGTAIFNWICALIFTNFAVFFAVFLLSFQIGS